MSGQQDKKIICPECGDTLKEVYVEANYGRALLLDQCHRCGGIWFDTWELYYLNDAEAKRLDAVDMNIFLADNPAQKGSGLCPRCNNTSLESFQDPNLPSDSRALTPSTGLVLKAALKRLTISRSFLMVLSATIP